MARIFITGSNGFIGRNLVKALHNQSYEVVPISRTEWDMKDPFPDSILKSGDIVIHCAYSKFTKGTGDLNYPAALSLKSACKRKSCRVIFFSTVSAHDGATSVYGKSKLNAEKVFDTGDTIIRPGLVLGNDGGLFQQMFGFVKEKGVVPLIDGGKQPLQTIYIHDLTEAIFKIVKEERAGTFILCEPRSVSFKQFYKHLCFVFNLKARFIPVPSTMLLILLRFAEIVKVKLPVDQENLKGLRSMIAVDSSDSLRSLGIKLKSFKESLELIKSNN